MTDTPATEQLPCDNPLRRGFMAMAESAVPYFSRWTYDEPFVVSQKTDEVLRRLQQVLYTSICYLGNHYENYLSVIPVPEDALPLLRMSAPYPYNPGTYRMDYLIDEVGKVRLLEITCRFPLNGIFISGFFNLMAARYAGLHDGLTRIDDYAGVFDYLLDAWRPFDHICYLKDVESRNESKYAIPIFEKAGFKVHALTPGMLVEQSHLLDKALIFNELNSQEIFSLPQSILDALVRRGVNNDFRTAFMVHDKRFFALLQNAEFQRSALSPVDAAFLREHLVPTFSKSEPKDIWRQARRQKDDWVLKEPAKGKSIGVHVGCVTPEEEWQALFESGRSANMVLQPYIRQKRFPGTVGGKSHYDYVVGTIMTCNDRYFGPGVVRASSFPVTNIVDDRKIFPLVTTDTERFPNSIIV